MGHSKIAQILINVGQPENSRQLHEIHTFVFFQEIYPGQFEPSPSHKFIRLIEKHRKLLRNFTQNIDTLEQVAGIEKVIQCHGKLLQQ